MQHALIRLICRLAGVLAFWIGALAAAAPLSTAVDYETAIGRSTTFLQETDGRLELPDAIAAHRAGRFTPGKGPVLNFGIGAQPVWIRFTVENPGATPVQKRLAIENAWLDRIEVYFVHQGQTVVHRAGDRLPFRQRPVMSRHFLFDHDFATGASEVFIRVETPDPMVVPIHLQSREVSRVR